MKFPKKIMINTLYDEQNPSYQEYKFHGFEYKNCARYVHWWQSPDGKWHAFFKYIEEGNSLYYKLQKFLKTGEIQTGVKFIYD